MFADENGDIYVLTRDGVERMSGPEMAGVVSK